MSLANKKILLFGGSGSLGNKFIDIYLGQNTIVNYSRDECKHWQMGIKYNNNPALSFIIGDIRDYARVESSILRVQPNIIIIMSALKHIDRCEYAIEECIKTNLTGPLNVVNAVESNIDRLAGLESVVMISTDKACEPTNVYGMSKALAESAIVEKSLTIKQCKFVNVRYGNVLNSRGSIIPLLHEKGKDTAAKSFSLTHPEMTRFVMTLEQSVELIEHAILYAESGDTVIPKLVSMRLLDLMELFSEKYDKPITITGLRSGEKMLESLISETQALRLVHGPEGYMYIKPPYLSASRILNQQADSAAHPVQNSQLVQNYNSKINPLSKLELLEYLNQFDLLD